jgi:hypothetical protein
MEESEPEYKKVKNSKLIVLNFPSIAAIIFKTDVLEIEEYINFIKRIINHNMWKTCHTAELNIKPTFPVSNNEYLVFNQKIEKEEDIYNYWLGYYNLIFHSKNIVELGFFCAKRGNGEIVFKDLLDSYPQVNKWFLDSLSHAKKFWKRQGFIFKNGKSKGYLSRGDFSYNHYGVNHLMNILPFNEIFKTKYDCLDKIRELFIKKLDDDFHYYKFIKYAKYKNTDFFLEDNTYNTYFIFDDNNDINYDTLDGFVDGFVALIFIENSDCKKYMNIPKIVLRITNFYTYKDYMYPQDILNYVNSFLTKNEYLEIDCSFSQKQKWLKAGAKLIDEMDLKSIN